MTDESIDHNGLRRIAESMEAEARAAGDEGPTANDIATALTPGIAALLKVSFGKPLPYPLICAAMLLVASDVARVGMDERWRKAH